MLQRTFSLTAVVLACCVFAGCAATPTVKQVQPVEADSSRYRAVQVVVEAPDTIRTQPGYDVTAEELGREFIDNVLASGKYPTVNTTVPAGKNLQVQLTITEFNYVSGAARGTMGIIAGRAILGVRMTVKDSESGAELGTVTAGHTSSHAQGVFSPVTSTQIKAIAKELAAALTNR